MLPASVDTVRSSQHLLRSTVVGVPRGVRLRIQNVRRVVAVLGLLLSVSEPVFAQVRSQSTTVVDTAWQNAVAEIFDMIARRAGLEQLSPLTSGPVEFEFRAWGMFGYDELPMVRLWTDRGGWSGEYLERIPGSSPTAVRRRPLAVDWPHAWAQLDGIGLLGLPATRGMLGQLDGRSAWLELRRGDQYRVWVYTLEPMPYGLTVRPDSPEGRMNRLRDVIRSWAKQ